MPDRDRRRRLLILSLVVALLTTLHGRSLEAQSSLLRLNEIRRVVQEIERAIDTIRWGLDAASSLEQDRPIPPHPDTPRGDEIAELLDEQHHVILGIDLLRPTLRLPEPRVEGGDFDAQRRALRLLMVRLDEVVREAQLGNAQYESLLGLDESLGLRAKVAHDVGAWLMESAGRVGAKPLQDTLFFSGADAQLFAERLNRSQDAVREKHRDLGRALRNQGAQVRTFADEMRRLLLIERASLQAEYDRLQALRAELESWHEALEEREQQLDREEERLDDLEADAERTRDRVRDRRRDSESVGREMQSRRRELYEYRRQRKIDYETCGPVKCCTGGLPYDRCTHETRKLNWDRATESSSRAKDLKRRIARLGDRQRQLADEISRLLTDANRLDQRLRAGRANLRSARLDLAADRELWNADFRSMWRQAIASRAERHFEANRQDAVRLDDHERVSGRWGVR